MKKLLVVLFLMLSLVVVGCDKGATGFDKPEDLGAKIASLYDTMDLDGFMNITHFEKAEDKAKAKAFYAATKDTTKKLMDLAKSQNKDLKKCAYKENKVEGDKGTLTVSTFMGFDQTFQIVKVEGKWFLSSTDEFIAEAVTKDPATAAKELEESLKSLEEQLKKAKEEAPKAE